MRKGSSLLSTVRSTFSIKQKICNLNRNPLYLGYLSMNQTMETIQNMNGTEQATSRALTRKSLKSEIKSENEGSILNSTNTMTRTRASARFQSRPTNPTPVRSHQDKSKVHLSNDNDIKEGLEASKKKRGNRKKVSSKDSCQKSDVQLKPKSEKLLKKDVISEKDLSQTKEKPIKRTRVKNDSAKSGKNIKIKSEVHDIPLPDNQKFVGAHLSIAGGLYKCIEEAVRIGARSCGLFLKSQRQWASKPMTEETIQKFKETIQKYNFPVDKLLPHGSYLLNCGSPDVQTLEKSRTALIDELQRCEMLGISLYNFHPGSTCGKISREDCLDRISESINIAHSQTNQVITVVENMSCQGNTIGGKLEELKGIIDRVKDKSRIGVCIDTCHAFAAGYDVSTEAGFKLFMQQLDEIVGLQYLKAIHLNDSKGMLGCHLDRHENIGKGHIGIEGFKLVMREPSFNNLPMILETPMDLSDEEEIKILNSL